MAEFRDIRSVVRGLDMLELVGNAPGGLRLCEIAEAMNVHRQTAQNMLQTLVRKNFVERLPGAPRYKLGAVMRVLQERQDQWNRNYLAKAIPVAIRLSRVTGCDAVVGQHTGGVVLGRFIARGDPDQPSRPLHSFQLSPYGSSMLFQAFMDPAELARFRSRHPLEDRHLQYWKSFELMDEFFGYIRSSGYLAMVRDNMFRASAPLISSEGQVRGILSITKPYRQFDPGVVGPCVRRVRQAAVELTAQIREAETGRDGRRQPG